MLAQLRRPGPALPRVGPIIFYSASSSVLPCTVFCAVPTVPAPTPPPLQPLGAGARSVRTRTVLQRCVSTPQQRNRGAATSSVIIRLSASRRVRRPSRLVFAWLGRVAGLQMDGKSRCHAGFAQRPQPRRAEAVQAGAEACGTRAAPARYAVRGRGHSRPAGVPGVNLSLMAHEAAALCRW